LISQTILLEFNNEGKPRYNKIVVLGRKLIDAKSQTPEEEQEITVIITKFTKRITEVERTVELHRIRLEFLSRILACYSDNGKKNVPLNFHNNILKT
jgi:hypothetical protein